MNAANIGLDITFHPVHNVQPRRFTPEQVAHFNDQGFISGLALFQGEALRALQVYFERAKARLTDCEPFRSYHHTEPELYDIVTNPLLVEHLQDLLGPNVVCFVSQYVCKEPGDRLEVKWHQDAAYNPVDAKSVIVWLAVTDANTENGCMWFVPGSHRAGLVDFTQLGRDVDISGGARVVNNAEAYGAPIPIELKAGQAVFFSDLLLHHSLGNRSANRSRGGFTMTFTSADVTPRLSDEFNVTNEESVLCSGRDAANNWKHNPRPQTQSSHFTAPRASPTTK